jgi:hypothetical protein
VTEIKWHIYIRQGENVCAIEIEIKIAFIATGLCPYKASWLNGRTAIGPTDLPLRVLQEGAQYFASSLRESVNQVPTEESELAYLE